METVRLIEGARSGETWVLDGDGVLWAADELDEAGSCCDCTPPKGAAARILVLPGRSSPGQLHEAG